MKHFCSNSIGEERSFLWAVTSTGLTSYELPKASVIEAMAQRVYDLLTSPNRNAQGETEQRRNLRQVGDVAQFSTSAMELSRVLLGPVAHQLARNEWLLSLMGLCITYRSELCLIREDPLRKPMTGSRL